MASGRRHGVHPVPTVPAPSSPALPGSRLAWVIGAMVMFILLAAVASLLVRRAGRARETGAAPV